MRYDNAVAGGLDEIGTLSQEEIIMENIEASCTIVSVAIRRATPASPAALRRLGSFVLILVVLIAAVAVVPASSSASPSQRSTALPESEGVQGVVAGDGDVYVVWADSPAGHSAAVSEGTGRVAWHADTARGAALVAAGDGVVWTAQNTGSSLVEQQGSTGRKLAQLTAPGGADWRLISAEGPYLFAMTDGPQNQVLSVYQGAKLIRSSTTVIPSSSACHAVVGGNSLYLACFGPVDDSVYRFSTATGQVLAHTPAMTLDGGQDLAYLNGSVYVLTSAQTNEQPETIVRLNAVSLRVEATSAPLDGPAIAATGTEVVALLSNGTSSPGSILTLDRATLARQTSTAIDSTGYPTALTVTPTDAYVVEFTGYSSPDGCCLFLIQVPLPGTAQTGDAIFHGSTGDITLAQPVVGMAVDPATGGYWLVASDGGVFSFDAPFFGSTGGIRLDAPIVGIAATPDGGGYFLVASDGGLFTFGDAEFHGSTGGTHLNEPVVGMAVDAFTGGYWLVARDGGIFSYDAPFYGSQGGAPLAQPVVGMAATADDDGYFLVASDGGVFTHGDAIFAGSAAGRADNSAVVGVAVDPATGGYWLTSTDGAVYSFSATPYGSAASDTLTRPVVGMAATTDGGGYYLVASDGGVFSY